MREALERYRRSWLVAGVVLAGLALFAPPLLIPPAAQPAGLAAALVLLCGVLLGIGRQGLDVLALRMLLVVVIAVNAWVLNDNLGHHHAACSGMDESQGVLACTQQLVLSLFLVPIALPALAVVAVPTAILWNRGLGSLKPELRLPIPRRWWQWVLMVLGAWVLLGAIALILGIPAPS